MFRPHSSNHGAVVPFEYLPASAGDYVAGQMLNMSGGKLVAISAASKTTPAYLCMGKHTVADGENLPVTRVSDDVIYETELSAEAAAAVPGSKLEVSVGGLAVDATAAGTFEVVFLEGTVAGSVVRGRFV